MKNLCILKYFALAFLILPALSYAQDPPGIVWEKLFPGDYETGNYTANDIKQSQFGGFVMTGRRSMTSTYGGYGEVMIMRVDEESMEINMNRTFTGTTDGIPWDQEAYDMIITPMPHIAYLLTGYRDKTLTSADTPPGLLVMEVWGNGNVLFDSLYYNNNLHHIIGRCIQPAIKGGYIIACSFREDGGGTEQTMLTRLVRNKEGIYVHEDYPSYKVIPVGKSGYASWIRRYGDGYLLGGTAYQDDKTKFDIFLQKLDVNYQLEWTKFYGGEDSDEFADALIAGDHIYIAGSGGVPVPNSTYTRDQIYVIKTDTSGEVVWKNSYGGNNRHYANKIMMTGEGDLLIAGTAYDQTRHTHMILMKIDAETGDSLWTQSYGSQFKNSGIRDAIRTEDFGYLVAGRGSYTELQDPRVYLMKLDHGDEKVHLAIPRQDLNIPITPSTPAIDVIKYTTNLDAIYGLTVMIDTLLHPSVGDLEVTLSHDGTTVTLADRPVNSGANFIKTGFCDTESRRLDWDTASYSSWYKPEEPLSVFKDHSPAGDWTLSIIDFGTGSLKSDNRVLEGWTLNMLTDPVSATGIPLEEALTNFGLENIRPNPLSTETRIRFRLNAPGKTSLSVYNLLGQLAAIVTEETLPLGVHERIWYPENLPPGTYFIHLESNGQVSVRKVVLR